MWLDVRETEDSIVWWTQRIRSQDVVGGRRDTWHYGGRNVSRATMWRRQCLRSQDVVGGRRDRGLYGGGKVSRGVMWL